MEPGHEQITGRERRQAERRLARAESREERTEKWRQRRDRFEDRHHGGWAIGQNATSVLFACLAGFVPMFLAMVFASDGWHTSPGLRLLLLVSGVLVAFGIYYEHESRGEKMWRAPRRRPWWRLRTLRAGDPTTCVYCRDGLSSAARLVACKDCHAVYHSECQAELGRCASLGCSGLGESPRPRAQTKS
jgi:hypothetical protein